MPSTIPAVFVNKSVVEDARLSTDPPRTTSRRLTAHSFGLSPAEDGSRPQQKILFPLAKDKIKRQSGIVDGQDVEHVIGRS